LRGQPISIRVTSVVAASSYSSHERSVNRWAEAGERNSSASGRLRFGEQLPRSADNHDSDDDRGHTETPRGLTDAECQSEASAIALEQVREHRHTLQPSPGLPLDPSEERAARSQHRDEQREMKAHRSRPEAARSHG